MAVVLRPRSRVTEGEIGQSQSEKKREEDGVRSGSQSLLREGKGKGRRGSCSI